MVGAKNNGYSFSKTICSICYEDLKPFIEDLQSISVCGHVFHELCLQQWFEYCPNVKKRSCPICKQTCSNANVARLYFQSVGDANDANVSQKPRNDEENPEELQKEVNRLEGKVLSLASNLEQQQKAFEEVKNQLTSCKEQLKVEMGLKSDALTQNATTQQLLRMKSEELDKLTLERMKLQERNLALAKELAALKLASDLDLEEDEIMKLASLGHGVGSKESIDVLRKSLVIRNKSYKELMAKCNILGRGEARCLHKLEKANEKIKKLKLRIQELERTIESRENEALRVLKDQDTKFKADSDETPMKRPRKQIKLDGASSKPDVAFFTGEMEPCELLSRNNPMNGNTPAHNGNINDPVMSTSIVNHEKIFHDLSSTRGLSSDNSRVHETVTTKTCQMPMQEALFDTHNDVKILKSSNEDQLDSILSVGKGRTEYQVKMLSADVDDELICYGDTNAIQRKLNVREDTRSQGSVPQPGEHCFTGGLMGPDGTNWHLGKWCKKGRNKGAVLSLGLQGSSARSGDLIAVGADGRGGQIKVMRSLDRSLLDTKDNTTWTKKSKHGAKPHKSQPHCHLQIEHFFQRTG